MFESLRADAAAPPGDLVGWWESGSLPPEVPDAPPGLSECAPSGWLALELDTATDDAAGLDDGELIEAVVAYDRVASWATARQARLLAEFARRRPGDEPTAVMAERPSVGSRYAPDEIGLALRISRGAAMNRLRQASQLAAELTDTRTAWEAGRLDAAKVRAICEAGDYLTPEHASAVQDRVLARAPKQSLGQLRAALARAVIAVDPDGAAERHDAARRDRRVYLGQEPDGMASLWALLSAPDAHSAYEWLTRLARGMGAEDSRGMDARRADLLVELLTGQLAITPPGPNTPGVPAGSASAPGGPPARRPVAPGKPLIQIVMPHTTLTGADDQPCELAGYGPIPADLAREIAADAVWKRLVTDPDSGALLDYGRTTYHPPAALADFVRARDVSCRQPMCRRAAANCELDHTIPYPHGTTSDDNMWAGCMHHHKLKHHAGWQVTQHPDGQIEWITPTGHRYTSEPNDYRLETMSGRPPPPLTPTPSTSSTPAPDRDPPPF